jgi:hypothetical protein
MCEEHCGRVREEQFKKDMREVPKRGDVQGF